MVLYMVDGILFHDWCSAITHTYRALELIDKKSEKGLILCVDGKLDDRPINLFPLCSNKDTSKSTHKSEESFLLPLTCWD